MTVLLNLGGVRPNDVVVDVGLDLARFRVVSEVLLQVHLALDAAVRDLADLLGVEALPALVVEVLVEGDDVDGVDEIDKGVADVALVVEVLGQVEEVEAARVQLVDLPQQHLVGVLVRDVANHDGGPRVFPPQDAVDVHHVARVRVLRRLGSRGRALGPRRPHGLLLRCGAVLTLELLGRTLFLRVREQTLHWQGVRVAGRAGGQQGHIARRVARLEEGAINGLLALEGYRGRLLFGRGGGIFEQILALLERILAEGDGAGGRALEAIVGAIDVLVVAAVRVKRSGARRSGHLQIVGHDWLEAHEAGDCDVRI